MTLNIGNLLRVHYQILPKLGKLQVWNTYDCTFFFVKSSKSNKYFFKTYFLWLCLEEEFYNCLNNYKNIITVREPPILATKVWTFQVLINDCVRTSFFMLDLRPLQTMSKETNYVLLKIYHKNILIRTDKMLQ